MIPWHRSLGRDTPRRRRARERLIATLWSTNGARRLPSDHELAAAIKTCDPRDVWWVCEMNTRGPIYFLPTREWISALSRLIDRLGVRRVLEVGAGDGFLSACLARRRPDLSVHAQDNGAWISPRARMSKRDVREFRAVEIAGLNLGAAVERVSWQTALARHKPELAIVSWAPPGKLVEQLIRSRVDHVLDVSVDGDVCGNGARTWRFDKEFLSGAIEARGLCRLDAAPLSERQTRVTLYRGSQR